MQLFNRKAFSVFIGIDPGTKTGIAVWMPGQTIKMQHLSTCRIHNAMFRVSHLHTNHSSKVHVRVEDASQAIFFRNTEKDKAKLQGAGSIKRDCQIWFDFLTELGVSFEMVRPNKRITKLTPEAFNKITHYTGKTSQHARDAGMLVVGF